MEDDQAELERAMQQTRARLEALFISLDGRETAEELVAMLEGVERFELAVEAAGGDLMVDEGPRRDTIEPDDPHFVLPRRTSGESVASYLDRLALATDHARHHRAH